jgi:hypothetical protein
MHNRLRLVRLATAVLYFGPLLAGLIGQGWGMIPVFVAIFLLWSVIVRPHLWPATLSDLPKSEALVAMASLLATQILLVVICFGLGRGIGGVLALKPDLPAYLPAALSFLSVPLSRMILNPHAIADEVALAPIEPGTPVGTDEGRALAEEMLAQVMALPDDVPESELQQHLSAISLHVDPDIIRKVLSDAVTAGKATQSGVKAMIVHATDPEVSNLMSGSAYPSQAFAAAGHEPSCLSLFARRCVLALEDEPELALDCPTVGALERAAQDVGDSAAAEALQRLIGLLELTGLPKGATA